MTDIVERLRDDTKYCQCSFMDIYKPIEMEAADEIERLREALKIFADNVKETNMGIDENWAKTVYPLKAENHRLRKRVELLEGYLNGALNVVEGFVHCDTTDARQALGEKE